MAKIRILIADDHAVLREGMHRLLELEPDMEVIGEANDGHEAVKMATELEPDIILMDIGMPILDGIKATRELKKFKDFKSKIIMLTSHEDEQDVLDAMSAGANSYCMKDVEPEILVAVIKSTYEGASWLDPRIAQIVLDKFVDKFGKFLKSDKTTDLTEREVDVLNLIAKGCSNQEIFIAHATCRFHNAVLAIWNS